MDALHAVVAKRIRQLAAERRLPLTHLADRAGVARTQVWAVLRGSSSPTLEWLAKVARALDVQVIDLLREVPSARPGARRVV